MMLLMIHLFVLVGSIDQISLNMMLSFLVVFSIMMFSMVHLFVLEMSVLVMILEVQLFVLVVSFLLVVLMLKLMLLRSLLIDQISLNMMFSFLVVSSIKMLSFLVVFIIKMLSKIHNFVTVVAILVVLRLIETVIMLVRSLLVISMSEVVVVEVVSNSLYSISVMLVYVLINFFVGVTEHVPVVVSTGVVRLSRSGVDRSCIMRSSFGTNMAMSLDMGVVRGEMLLFVVLVEVSSWGLLAHRFVVDLLLTMVLLVTTVLRV